MRGKAAKRASSSWLVGALVSHALRPASAACPGCLLQSFLTLSWVTALCVAART